MSATFETTKEERDAWGREPEANSRFDRLIRDFAKLEEEVGRLRTEAAKWKANHDEMVARNAVLRDRPDLPADRLPALASVESAARDDEAGKIEAWLQGCADQPIVPDDPVPVEVQRGSRKTFSLIASAVRSRSYRGAKE